MKRLLYILLAVLLACCAYEGTICADVPQNSDMQKQRMVEMERDDLVRIATVLSLCARANSNSSCSYVFNCSDPSDPLFDQINAVVNSIVAILNANSDTVVSQIDDFDIFLSQYDQLFNNKVLIIEDELFDSSDNIGGVVEALSVSDAVICSKLTAIEAIMKKTLEAVALGFGIPLVTVDEIVEELNGEELSAALENLSVVLEIIADVGKGIA